MGAHKRVVYSTGMKSKFNIGQVVYTEGFDMRCRFTVERATVVNYEGSHPVIESDGVRMLAEEDDLYATKKDAVAAVQAAHPSHLLHPRVRQ